MPIDYQSIREQAIEFMLGRNWKIKTAKSRGFQQSLFDHTLVELDALITLLPVLGPTFSPALSEQEEQILLTSVIAHDVGKELDEWQKYIHGERKFLSDVNRELTEEVVPQLAALLGFTDGIAEMISGVLLHMRNERTPAKEATRLLLGQHTNPRWRTLATLVDAIDNFCSASGLFKGLHALKTQAILPNHLLTAYHLVQMRGVSTTFLHLAAIDAFESQGWKPLLHYSNGTIYVANPTAQVCVPTPQEIEQMLAKKIQEAFPANMASLIVGSPIETMIPKPDLFDFNDLRACLNVAAQKINRASFARKPEATRRKTVEDYYKQKGMSVPVTFEMLAAQTERIGAAQPEMCVFKFFKYALADDFLGDIVTPETQQTYADFAEGGSKKKAAEVTPQTVARVEYDRVFGAGAYADLQKTSTLYPARDMALTVDRFWSLDGAQFDLNLPKVEHLLDHHERQKLLIDTLVTIANRVYMALPEENRPTRATPAHIASEFMYDLVHPASVKDIDRIGEEQLRAYTETKVNARRDKGQHLCPICNQAFEGGTSARADFIANPETHTNRAVAHGNPGYITICNACKYERFLQQILLGNKVADVLVIFPRMNIGHSSGEILRKKVLEIWDKARMRMSPDNPDADQHVSLGVISSAARKLLNTKTSVDVFRLSATELVDLHTYKSSAETAKNHRRELERRLRELYGVDELTVEELNENWATDYTNVGKAIEALLANKVTDDDARKARAEAFRLVPQFHIVCQTPHMIMVPLVNPIALGDDSDTNAGIRELYVSLILGLALDCSVAVMRTGEVITFQGGEGVARVPPVPELRELIGGYLRRQRYRQNKQDPASVQAQIDAEWIPISLIVPSEVEPKYISPGMSLIRAIGAAALLAGDTAFSERSNLYAILKSPTVGHILRRIEQKSKSSQASFHHIRLLDILEEVWI